MQKYLITLLIAFQLVFASNLFAQNIALNATGNLPDTSAMLDVSSTNKGFLLPRMTTAQVTAIPLPATGLIVFNTTLNAFQLNAGTPASPTWQTLGTTVGNWLTGGNSGTNSGSKFIGTTDSVSMRFRTNNTQRMVLDSLGNVGIGATPSFTSSPNMDKFLVDAGITKSYNVITAKGAVNNYLQFNVQNQSTGTSASSDLVATADNGSETSNFINMGINGSGNTDGTMGAADDAYLFNIGNNLLLGACSSTKAIVFVTGGTSQATNERMRIDGTGKVGIGTTTPASSLDVKGILHLSGATSGYVGFAPAAAAGSTTYTLPVADGTSGQQLTTNGSGTLSWAAAGSGSGTTTNALNSSANIITSTVNGVAVTANAVNTVANTSSTNTLTTSVNGIAATGVNIINTNALSLSGGNLTSTVNGIASSTLALSALDSSIYKMDGTLWAARTVSLGANNLTFGSSTGNLIFNPSSTGKVGIGTITPGSSLDVKGTLHLSGSTSGYVGFVPAAIAGTTTYTLPTGDGSNGQSLTTNGTGALSWATPSMTVTHLLNSSGNILSSTVNGVTDTAKAINTNALSLSGTSVTSTVNGVASSALDISPAFNASIWKLTGNSSTSATTNYIGTSDANDFVTKTNGVERMRVTSGGNIGIGTASPNYFLHIHDATVNPSHGTWMQISNNASGSGSYDGFYYGVNATGGPEVWAKGNLDFITGSGTTNNYTLRLTPTGYVGIGTQTPASALDVKGTLHLSGSNSGYVGFAPAASAGSTTYTLPNADGTNGQQLTTNGSGTLSWTSAGGSTGWGLTGNSGTSSSTNYMGTSDNNDVIFKRNNYGAGSLTLTNTSFGDSSSATTHSAAFGNAATASGTYSVALGNSSAASGSASVVVGYGAFSTMPNSVAVGAASYVQPGSGSIDDIAIGNVANVSGGTGVSYSTAIGSAAQVQAANGLAIGRSSVVSAQYGISIGDASQAQGVSAVVLGENAYANGISSIAIGGGAAANKTQAQGTYSISLGYYAYTSNQDGIAIGDHAQAQGTNTTVIGTGIYNGTSNTVAIGNTSVTSFLMNGASAGTNKALVVGSGSTNGNGAYLTTGGTWTNASDRNLKDDFSTVDGEDILNKVAQLDITRWKYKGTAEYHIGPMAQDFYQSFKLGNDDKHISTIDPAGIALISIKALKQENDNLNKKLEAQQTLIEKLQRTLDEIKARLQ